MDNVSLRHHRIAWLVCFAATALTPWGCGRSGPEYWPVRGNVTFRGKPVAVGLVRFSNPQMGVDVVAELDADGKYVIVTAGGRGLPKGRYHVAIVSKVDFSKVKSAPDGLPIPSTMPSAAERNPPNIPQKYHDPATSGLTLTVKPEPNTFDVDMQ